MELRPEDLEHRDVYKLLIGSIVPRPIAWVSTINADGQPNLAPFSFFTGVCSQPPTVLFCPGVRRTDGSQKDTYHNVQTTGEFVINFVSEPLAEAMNITATELPPDVNEFERAGLTPEPGKTVNVPHVKESPIFYECKLNQIVTITNEPGGGHVVIGTVTLMHFNDDVYRDGYYVDFDAYQAIGRMAGAGYSRTTDRFDIQRPPSEIKPS